MVTRGRVRNGVVVLEEGVHLPEGQEVTVIGGGSFSSGSSTQGMPRRHSVLDIPSVSLGALLHESLPDDDLLGEMLEGRQ
jgi:hypothetical protein